MPSNPKFIWYELMTTDAPAARAFYAAVVGWSGQDVGGGAYTTFHVGGAGGLAGMLSLSPQALAGGARPGWMGYVGVPDVDDYAARLTQAGGTVHQPPSDIPGIGRFCPVSDTAGGGFVLFRGSVDEGPPTGAPGEAGYVGWRELVSRDGAGAWTFYAGLFGWSETGAFDMGPMGQYRLWSSAGEADEGGMMTGAPGQAPGWRYYFRVTGLDAAASRLTSAGGKVINGPHPVPSGDYVLTATDPQGAQFSLMSATK